MGLSHAQNSGLKWVSLSCVTVSYAVWSTTNNQRVERQAIHRFPATIPQSLSLRSTSSGRRARKGQSKTEHLQHSLLSLGILPNNRLSFLRNSILTVSYAW